jgi:hypothetical protein
MIEMLSRKAIRVRVESKGKFFDYRLPVPARSEIEQDARTSRNLDVFLRVDVGLVSYDLSSRWTIRSRSWSFFTFPADLGVLLYSFGRLEIEARARTTWTNDGSLPARGAVPSPRETPQLSSCSSDNGDKRSRGDQASRAPKVLFS